MWLPAVQVLPIKITDQNNNSPDRFLLAQLYLDSLIAKGSLKALESALTKMCSGSNAYNNAIERIEGQHNDQEELAKQVLSWIACAKTPLRY